jgi:hypothetical protein
MSRTRARPRRAMIYTVVYACVRGAASYEAVGVLRFNRRLKNHTPPYYNTSVHPWALGLGGRLLLHPWAVPVASYRAPGPSGARK